MTARTAKSFRNGAGPNAGLWAGPDEAERAQIVLTSWYWLGAAFTAGGSFLTALGIGLREQSIERPGVALIGAALLAVLVAIKRALEAERPRPAGVRQDLLQRGRLQLKRARRLRKPA
jgi:hypothetical protein